LSNTTLEYVEKEKDIGVTIDSKLTFEHHMNEKINKTNSTMAYMPTPERLKAVGVELI
jgi:hypothetical protein